MKKVLWIISTTAALLVMTSCSSTQNVGSPVSEPEQVSTETEQTVQESTETEQTVQETSDFEEIVFECDSVKITVTGMGEMTTGNNQGCVGLDYLIENKTDKALTLPALMELDPGMIIKSAGGSGYPVGRKAGDTVILNKDGTGSFSHTWDIQDSNGNTVDSLSMQITIPSSIMDEVIASGVYYENGDMSPNAAEIINDDWIKVTTGADNRHISITNVSGKDLIFEDDSDNMSDFASGAEISYEDWADFMDTTTWNYKFSIIDPDSLEAVGKEGGKIDYAYTDFRYYTVTVSLVDGEYEVSYTQQ